MIDHGSYSEAICDDCFEREGPTRPPRACACGCGESLEGKRRGAKYLNHAHQQRGQRARDRLRKS